MADATTREEFKQYCLRRLGKPVINIEVSDSQLEDRIDDALRMYIDHHYDGSSKVYFKHQVTSDDKTKRYITLPDSIQGVTRVFPITGLSSGMSMFDIRYQIALNDLYTLTSHSMTPYFMTMQHLALLEQLLVGEKPIRFNRHQNRLYIDMDWQTVADGTWLVVEVNQALDPDTFEDIWKDRWLSQYATALIKRQWGTNTKKYGNMQMPGGQVFNGQLIFEEAEREIAELEDKIINDFSYPLGFEMG